MDNEKIEDLSIKREPWTEMEIGEVCREKKFTVGEW
jgi:hypothetical protein